MAHRGGALLFPSSAEALRRYHALDAGWLGEAHWNLTDTLRSIKSVLPATPLQVSERVISLTIILSK